MSVFKAKNKSMYIHIRKTCQMHGQEEEEGKEDNKE